MRRLPVLLALAVAAALASAPSALAAARATVTYIPGGHTIVQRTFGLRVHCPKACTVQIANGQATLNLRRKGSLADVLGASSIPSTKRLHIGAGKTGTLHGRWSPSAINQIQQVLSAGGSAQVQFGVYRAGTSTPVDSFARAAAAGGDNGHVALVKGKHYKANGGTDRFGDRDIDLLAPLIDYHRFKVSMRGTQTETWNQNFSDPCPRGGSAYARGHGTQTITVTGRKAISASLPSFDEVHIPARAVVHRTGTFSEGASKTCSDIGGGVGLGAQDCGTRSDTNTLTFTALPGFDFGGEDYRLLTRLSSAYKNCPYRGPSDLQDEFGLESASDANSVDLASFGKHIIILRHSFTENQGSGLVVHVSVKYEITLKRA